MWIVQDLLRDGARHASSGSAEIAFSPEDITRRIEELDAKELEARNAAEETAKAKSQTGAELLSAMLDRYKPEDFLSCYIPGKPEPVKGKADTFTLNVEISFNDKLYSENFIPDLVQVLDQIAAVKKNTMLVKYKDQLRDIAAKKGTQAKDGSIILQAFGNEKDYSLAVYNRPERFGVRLYGFNNADKPKVNAVLSEFMNRTKSIRGLVVELIDEDKETIESIEQTFRLNFLLAGGDKWAFHNTIINSGKENTRIIVPITLEMPEEVLPFVKNIKASLLIKDFKPGQLGVNLTGSSKGLYIATIISKNAREAGLKNGDIITAVGNKTGIKTAQEVIEAIADMSAGDTVSVKVLRNGWEMTFNVTLSAKQ